MSTPRRRLLGAIAAALLYHGAGPALRGQEPAASGAIRPLGPNLFPFYNHYLRTGDNTEVRTVFFFYHSTDRRERGDRTRLLLPLYYWQRNVDPPDRRLYLFPFLFFQRQSAEEGFRYALPLFFSRYTRERAFTLLFPVWWHTADLVKGLSQHRILFPLLRLSTDRGRPGEPETKIRLGLHRILEVFEAQVGSEARRFTGLNFFNWKGEADGGLALFRRERSPGTGEPTEERTTLFPLYFRSRNPDSDLLLAGPFTGHIGRGGVVRRYYTPFIWRAQAEGGFRSLLLVPLYHRATRNEPPLSFFASHPTFSYERTTDRRHLGILYGLLYGNTRRLDTGKTRHDVLFPLGRFEVEPDGSKGHRRMLPFYVEDWDSRRRLRLGLPLWWNYQSLAGKEVLTDFTLFLPTYVGWGAPRDYFATGFPLYWSSRTGVRGFDLLIPAFYRHNDATSSALYSFPVSRVNLPSQKAMVFLAGAASHRRFYDLRGAPSGRAVDLLWWLWGLERRPAVAQVRLFPLFWARRDGEDRRLLLFPLWYRQWGPLGTEDYFFPVYGQFRRSDGRLRRDFYALGSYVRTVEQDTTGSLARTRSDYLWSLVSFQTDLRRRLTHRRALPLGFWQTRSVSEDRTILGPFYYSHRIQLNDATHRLKLVLGNLYLEKSRDETSSPADSPPRSVPTPPPAGGNGPALEPAAASASRERGILWPVSRWGRDEKGDPFEWVLPFYYHSLSSTEEDRSFFPLLYTKREKGPYRTGYFRYFFLLNWERFEGGRRFTLGQLVLDWMADQAKSERRFRLLYPFLEARVRPQGYSYQVTPILQGEKEEEGGERRSRHFLFPLFFKGATELRSPEGGYLTDARYLYLFPLYGVNRKSLRTQHDFLIPFFHLRRSIDGFAFNIRPFFFLRREPEEFAVRLWPLHSNEAGEGSGEWWVSKYLYLSKLAVRRQSFRYRLDPFLFHTRRSPAEASTGALFRLVHYSRRGSGAGAERSWHAVPLAYGYSRKEDSGAGLFPLYYARDFSQKGIDYAVPWRFFFILNRLRGAGDRHLSLLWKLMEYTDSPVRPDYSEFRILEGLVVNRKTQTSRQLTLNPLFNYYRDDEKKLLDWSVLFSLYNYERVEGLRWHTVFWIFRF